MLTNIKIPNNLSFADLKLARDTDGAVSMDWSVIEQICTASDLPPEFFSDGSEDNLAALIVTWYKAHRSDGGKPDPVAEDLIAEAKAEDAAGQAYSYKPGRA